MPHQPPQYLQFLPFLIILPILYFRLRRMAKTQALKLGQLWIRPTIFIALAALVLLMPARDSQPLQAGDVTWLLLAAVLGAAAGWQWGRTTQLHLHPENGTLMQKGSVAGIMVFLVLLLLRLGLRTGLGLEAGAWNINMLLVTDASIIFSALLFAVRGLEIFLRARRIMAGAAPATAD
jgi:hypothetical protein